MFRRVTMSCLTAGLLTASVGCRSSCGEKRGLFGHASQTVPAYALTGKPGGGDCFGGEPIPGQLMSMPSMPGMPMGPGMPSGAGMPNELPMPQPSDLIPGQRIPFAPPAAAPPSVDGSLSSGSGGLKTSRP